MKVFYRNGQVNARAESLADIQTLLGMQGAKLDKEVSDIAINGHSKTWNTWKGKHKVMCETCQKPYKNIKLHKHLKHNPLNLPV